MPKLVINLSSHPQPSTVSQMRKRLAQVLSKLNGDQEVSFNFIATLENYKPPAVTDPYRAFEESMTASLNSAFLRHPRFLAKPRILEAPYGVAPQKNYCLHPNGVEDGICHSCMLSAADAALPAVYGELARPEND